MHVPRITHTVPRQLLALYCRDPLIIAVISTIGADGRSDPCALTFESSPSPSLSLHISGSVNLSHQVHALYILDIIHLNLKTPENEKYFDFYKEILDAIRFRIFCVLH